MCRSVMRVRRKIISAMLAMVMVLGVVTPTQATGLQDEKDSLENQIDQALAEKEALVKRINELSASMKATEAQLEKKAAEIDETEQDLIMAKLEKNAQYESMRQRIKYMYESGNTDYFQILLESQSISDFLIKAEYILQLSEYDRDKLFEFQDTIEEIEEKELTLKVEYENISALQENLTKQSQEVQSLLSAKSAELADMQSQLADVKNQIKKAEEEERRRQEAAAANKKPANSSKPSSSKPPVVSGNGYFTHPCPGMSYQSSYFGEVRHGIGDTRPHSGHDYAAPKGTPIYAAAAGTVLIARYSNSAGYWVVIDHGNGLTTKYMHMFEMPYVSEGQKVVKGQHIGGVGTTGQSTGNHLHFQVEENGVPVNPSKYL